MYGPADNQTVMSFPLDGSEFFYLPIIDTFGGKASFQCEHRSSSEIRFTRKHPRIGTIKGCLRSLSRDQICMELTRGAISCKFYLQYHFPEVLDEPYKPRRHRRRLHAPPRTVPIPPGSPKRKAKCL